MIVGHGVLVDEIGVADEVDLDGLGARQLTGEGRDSLAHSRFAGLVVNFGPNPVLNDAAAGVAVDRHLAEEVRLRRLEDVARGELLGDVLAAVRIGRQLGDFEPRHRRRVVKKKAANAARRNRVKQAVYTLGLLHAELPGNC